jgi:hypothetical protein
MNVASSKHVLGLLQKAAVGRSVMIGAGLSSLRPHHGLVTRSMATRSLSRGGRGGRKSKVPTMMEIARAMPLTMKDINNSDLVTLGALGNADARREMLVRHIMAVDKVSYDTATATFMQIAAKNRQGMWLLTVPYKIGIGVACTAAFASFPLVFDLSTVQWFNENFVTADIPEPKDLETPLEVGSWAWNWMEPPLGQISFCLLCLQFTRYVPTLHLITAAQFYDSLTKTSTIMSTPTPIQCPNSERWDPSLHRKTHGYQSTKACPSIPSIQCPAGHGLLGSNHLLSFRSRYFWT